MVVYAQCKDTNFLANHNEESDQGGTEEVVYAQCKDTNFLANHNVSNVYIEFL